MNPRNSQYIKDIYSYIETVPFGEVTLRIRRTNRKTTEISTTSEETLRYINNEEAKTDLDNMVQRLIDASFSGEAHIKLEMKDGNIRLIGIFDRKDQKYN